MAQRAEYQIHMVEVNAHSGNILLLDFFYFHVVTPVMSILPFLPVLCVCEKLECQAHFQYQYVTCEIITNN